MKWFSNVGGKKLDGTKKKDIPSGLWTKCLECNEILYTKELEKNLNVCLKCGYHFKFSARERVQLLVDEDLASLVELNADLVTTDPLRFKGGQKYKDKAQASRKKTKLSDAIVCYEAHIESNSVIISVLAFEFMGGSMGTVVGEKICRSVDRAIATKRPLLIVSASGGARMQEGVLSLMQMAKTSAALAELGKHGIPFISLITNPTTGGVIASFASLGDVIISEPKALLAFTGPRVIENTIREQLPEGFQRAEFLLEHGMIDMIVERKDLRDTIGKLLKQFSS